MRKVAIILSIIFIGLCNFLCLNVNAKEIYEEIDECNEIQLYLKEDVYDVSSTISLEVYVGLTNKIINYDYNEEGFNYNFDLLFDEDKITLSVCYDLITEKPHFNLCFLLDNNCTLRVNLYGYIHDESIYLSAFSFEEAFEVYNYYYKQNNNLFVLNSEFVCLLENRRDLPNTYVQGTLQWTDDLSVSHPLQYTKVQLWDRQPTTDRLLLQTYTSVTGSYYFEFHNADQISDNEDGGYDIYVKILPEGEDVIVERYNGNPYELDIGYVENVVTGSTTYASYNFSMGSPSSPNILGRAFQVSQACITASRYYEAMKGSDVANVSVVYPHQYTGYGCFYSEENQTIYIVNQDANITGNPNSYASWDGIMHEYGHFVSHRENLFAAPSYGHSVNTLMSEHYKKHFSPSFSDCNLDCALEKDPTSFTESECKYKGNAKAWAEGWATFYSIASQEYYGSVLTNIATVNDMSYSTYHTNGIRSIENNFGVAESAESTVEYVLYDIYDISNSESFDTLGFGHTTMWSYFINSSAKTLDEFNQYIMNNISKNNLRKYSELLYYHNLSPSEPTPTDNLSYFCPTFSWNWSESTSTDFFNNRTYKLNFYDFNYNYIGSSSIQSYSTHTCTISESIWSYILNSSTLFYSSVTIYENNTPITSYEGKWSVNHAPEPIYIAYNSIKNGTLSIGECYWYKFTAPQSATYYFETTGNTDTYGEIFSSISVGQSIANRLSYDDDSGANTNFKIYYSLSQGQIVYIRVRGYNWTSTGNFSFTVSSDNHLHIYNYNYVYYNSLYHYSYCSCGNFVYEYHDWNVEANGYRCNECGYFTTGPIINPRANSNGGFTRIACILKKDDFM